MADPSVSLDPPTIVGSDDPLRPGEASFSVIRESKQEYVITRLNEGAISQGNSGQAQRSRHLRLVGCPMRDPQNGNVKVGVRVLWQHLRPVGENRRLVRVHRQVDLGVSSLIEQHTHPVAYDVPVGDNQPLLTIHDGARPSTALYKEAIARHPNAHQ
jgi:hypothetical protein